jgi:hypothetical protein
MTKGKPAYEPPRIYDVAFVAKAFGKWSSGTMVTILELEKPNDEALVRHIPTKEEFLIPIDLLVRKRVRNRD